MSVRFSILTMIIIVLALYYINKLILVVGLRAEDPEILNSLIAGSIP